MESDNVSVSESVAVLNEGLPEGYGIDYYTHSSGMHVLTLRNSPEMVLKTKDTTRALNFVTFYSAGVDAGQVAERRTRDEQSEVTSSSDQTMLRRTLNKLLGKA